MKKNTAYTLSCRIWIMGEKGTFLGKGRVRLLEEIERMGSIAKAAGKLNMSYKKAWESVDAMNREAAKPLVEKTSGGKGGGGAILTLEGKKAIKNYLRIVKNTEVYITKQLQTF